MKQPTRNRRNAPYGAPEAPTGTLEKLIQSFNGWRLGLTLDPDAIWKSVVIGALILVFTVLQTTLFTRFRPFGAVPDLLLPFVIAVGCVEKERRGAVSALIAAFVIDAAGGTTLTLLPLLYVPAAFACGILSTNSFRDSVFVNGVYTVTSSALRGILTFIIVMSTVNGVGVWQAISDKVIPEFFANILLAAFPQLVTRAALRPFHKTREERTQRRRDI